MIRKIISSGRTGVELAALDVAIKLGISHGGWTSRGMRNEEGSLSQAYGLVEVPSVGFQRAMEENVIHSDGTLLVSFGNKTPETGYAVKMALKHQRQFLHVDLSQNPAFEGASLTSSWVSLQKIKEVFVTGPASSHEPKIYIQARKILETVFYLGLVKSGLHPEHSIHTLQRTGRSHDDFPQTVDEAVLKLKKTLPLKDRAVMANMQPDELDFVHAGLGEYIKQNFGLYSGNKNLLQSCADSGQLAKPIPDEACAVILRALWKDLQSTHKLRVIK